MEECLLHGLGFLLCLRAVEPGFGVRIPALGAQSRFAGCMLASSLSLSLLVANVANLPRWLQLLTVVPMDLFTFLLVFSLMLRGTINRQSCSCLHHYSPFFVVVVRNRSPSTLLSSPPPRHNQNPYSQSTTEARSIDKSGLTTVVFPAPMIILGFSAPQTLNLGFLEGFFTAVQS